MNDEAWFPKSYDDARQTFLSLTEAWKARWPGAEARSYQVPSQKDHGLFVDYLYLPAKKEPRAIIALTSGVHGPETFTGHALQRLFLEALLPSFSKEDVGFLIVHSLNPFGFKYERRSTENNVNLNRNFASTEETFNHENPGYAKLASALEPATPIGGLGLSFLKTLKFMAGALTSGGFTAASLNQGLFEGQFRFPKGLEYGGTTWEPQVNDFIRYTREKFAPYREVAVFDLHTGLGDRYQLHLIPVDDPLSRDAILLDRLFKREQEQHLYAYTPFDTEGFYSTKGDLNTLVPTLASKGAKALALTFEFGTRGAGLMAKLKTFNTIQVENQGFHHGYKTKAIEAQARRNFMETFFPSEIRWRQNAVERARTIFQNVLSRI